MWDVFISHASEDKEAVARPLEIALSKHGLRVWFDKNNLKVGDSLRKSINEGLSKSTFGIVILSSAFFSKEWPQAELDGLTAKQSLGKKVILPVWHNITKEEIMKYSPILADTLAVDTSKGIEVVVNELLAVLAPKRKLENINAVKLRFRDELWLDPLSVKVLIKSLSSGIEIVDVEWPPATQLLIKELENLLQEMEDYRASDSIFYGRSPDWVADIYEMANDSYQLAVRMQRSISLRIPKIWQGLALDGEQQSYGSLRRLAFEEALPNLLALVNLQIQLHIALLIHANIVEKRERVPSHLHKWLNLKWPHNRDIVECLYGVNDPVYAIRFRVREVEQYAYIPKSKLAQAYTDVYKPNEAHRNFWGWFHELLIPQIEWVYSEFGNNMDSVIYYREIWFDKIRDEKNRDNIHFLDLVDISY